MIGGCAAEPAPSSPGKTEAPEKTTEQVFELVYSDWGPEQIDVGQAAVKAIKIVEERTNGRDKITPYFSESLVKYEDAFSAVATGVTDMSMYVSTFKYGHS